MSDANNNSYPATHQQVLSILPTTVHSQPGIGSTTEYFGTSSIALTPASGLPLERQNFSGIVKPSPSGSSTSCFCRICHEGDSKETLVAPCRCSGTVALIHTTCLEHWLTASNSDQCEICKQSYKVVKVPRPCMEYFHDPSNQFNVRNLIADVICFFLLTPLLVVSTYLCSLGAHQYLQRERWEAVGLVILSLFLLAVYFTWCHVTTKFHIAMWRSWQKTHQQIRLVEINERRFRNNTRQEQSRGPVNPIRSPLVLHNNNYVELSASQLDTRPLFTQSQRFGVVNDYFTLDEDHFTRSDLNRAIVV